MSIAEALRRAREREQLAREIELGIDLDGQPIKLGYEDLQYHTHIIGLSGRGKSRQLEYIMRQLLVNRWGFTLIDPHGDIYEALMHWLTRQRSSFFDNRTIHLFDPAHPTWRFGYNPLRVPEDTPEELRDVAHMDNVETLMEAVVQVNRDDVDRMPMFQRTFATVLYTLAHNGLTIYEAMKLLPASEEAFREHLARNLPDEVARAAWQEMHSWRLKEYSENVASLYNRMHRMMRHPFVRQIFGQTGNTLDLRRVMDNGEVILANFQPRPGFPIQNADLIARILFCDFVQTALGRVANKSRPHFLIVDECYRYLTSDIETILTNCRKFGLHMMLAHQTLRQLQEAGDFVCDGVIESAQNKLVFGQSYRSAIQLADELFAHEYNLERSKQSMERPVQVGMRRTTFRGQAFGQTSGASWADIESYGEASSNSWGDMTARMENAVIAHGFSYDANGNPVGQTGASTTGYANTRSTSMSGSKSFSHSRGSTQGGTEAQSYAQSEMEGLEPIYEILPTQLYSLEEERHRKAVEMVTLGRQGMIVKTHDNRGIRGTTIEFDRVEASFERAQACYERLFSNPNSFNKSANAVREELKLRWEQLDQWLVSTRDLPAIEASEELKDADWE